MPFCGFNEKMLKGLTAFCEGLVEHGLMYRSEKNEETLDQAIKREISDLTRLQLETYRLDNTSKRIMTGGIVNFAQGFYLMLREHGTENIPRQYKEIIGGIMQYFFNMDNKYYDELEGKPEDMKDLIEYLNSQKI